MRFLRKLPIIIVSILILMLLIFVLQNSGRVEVVFLGWYWWIPKSLIMVACFIVGLIAGIVFDAIHDYRADQRKKKEQKMKEHLRQVEDENAELKKQAANSNSSAFTEITNNRN